MYIHNYVNGMGLNTDRFSYKKNKKKNCNAVSCAANANSTVLKGDSKYNIQKIFSGLMALSAGILVSGKLSKLRFLGGLIAAIFTYSVCDILDKYIDEELKKRAKKMSQNK